MSDAKGPVAAGAAGIVVILAAALSLFVPRSSDLVEKVDKYFERADAQSSAERHRDVGDQVTELEGITSDKEFDRLPKTKRDAVTDRLTELKAYEEYAAAVEKIEAPASATNESKLKEIQEQVGAIKVPVAYQVEWSETDAGQRQRRLKEDAEALERAVNDTERAYHRLWEESEQLRKNPEGADLPGRARKILADGEKLPTPEADKDKPVPGAKDVTYASVFAFERVGVEYRRWEPASKLLKRLAALKR